MSNDNLNKLHAWEMIKVVQDVVIVQLAKQAESNTVKSDIDPSRLIEDAKFRKQVALENKVLNVSSKSIVNHQAHLDISIIPIHLRPRESAHELFAQEIGHLISGNKYDLTLMQNDFTENHVTTVVRVINTSLEITEKWAKAGDGVDHHRFEQLIHAALLISIFREKMNRQDLAFRDASQYFVGRLCEWQRCAAREKRRTTETAVEESSHDNDAINQIAELLKNIDKDQVPLGNLYWSDLGAIHYHNFDKGDYQYIIVEKLLDKEALEVAKNAEMRQKVIDKCKSKHIQQNDGQ